MQVPDIVRNVLRSSAPTLLAALSLPPPLNGIAASVTAGALDELDRRGAGGRTGAARTRPVTAEDAVRVIAANAGDPEIFATLRKAEQELKRYQKEAGIRFEELAVRDRERAADLQSRGLIAETAYRHGMRIVWIAIASMMLIILAALWVAVNGVPATDAQYMVAAFGIIGTAVGFINGIAGSVVTFYYGSSQGSKDKTEAMADSMRRFGDQLGRAAERARPVEEGAPASPAPLPVPAATPPEESDPEPAPSAFPPREGPASLTLVAEMLPDLTRPHRHFEGSAMWHLSTEGISVDGAPAARTPGKSATVERIWDRYGHDCADAAVRFGVPVELIVATIATESGGDPNARRDEPQLGTESVGLMQTLITTAREALGNRAITGDDLLDPATSIAAGTAYIAQQRKSTHFDPPLVAAAYNAGSLRRDPLPQNRWRLLCYPKGTGAHIDRFVAWFGDAMAVSAGADWCRSGQVPSFAGAFRQDEEGEGETEGESEEAEGAKPLSGLKGTVPRSRLGQDRTLAKTVQARLSELGYLDPPPDGAFGPISTWALETFAAQRGLELGADIAPAIFRALSGPDAALPDFAPCAEHPWIDRVIAGMRERGHWICRVPECRNIVYLEGTGPDGRPNADRADAFNDLRAVFWRDAGGRTRARVWQATTEPGRYFTDNPLNPEGAARIGFGQYKAWRVGMHRAGTQGAHEALVQVSDIEVRRDRNRDHARAGDRTFTGLFGINQHWGYDLPADAIGRSSAGCLVGRTREGHREFMAEVKRDPRYLANDRYRFVTTILPGAEVLG